MNNSPKQSDSINLIVLSQVCQKTQLGKTSIYSKINPNSKYHDPSFPRSIRISDARIAWIESELNEWIASKIEASRSSAK
ncbi:AlpA family phage regulatory protein [Lampropedia puyangensis]|uniref:AlpA family phage regulatory protein n=1 Tax=Lampropedia puyangensis TaxID=1330072 RepID=A0A4S8EVW5_9BURK|nr:AlpA family phage regulatory protein [Lampropedia puyangensis]THT97703.1 AlpA family phage regulatory protein [Lampropedia puyangensis]